ncbi:UDP-N-acetylglucosamine--undecaprenyl-phosphate N-acetylglucosaminephosphotransferase [Glaciecola petra]|uniref:Undecaprenyl-phosphate alpha-N-acetylglucosaminyl 1-phosphate transferase n=1 Tax=Glaciecola petra TaxID=3075602 RepID=A0ABU2ZMN8_9ALTE|nr:UDP-N-acetylglucosamine--undecaprenyl-phosphate N-acetylglucosaminephosphotransferase [Aestuariibacter sp. P117]MDT0593676.1 UDP-N-acetylglucosamine--undecaprenyl-phosphate N-acetylglucosaminephosphotransferase [Aestuariibacter sp. P117]
MIELFFVFFFSFASLFLLRKVAKVVGLVDEPTLRKRHEGVVPLVGGIAVFITVAQFLYSNPEVLPHSSLFLVLISILTIVGALDDKYDISFKIRLVVQTLLTCSMIYFTGIELTTIGDIFGFGEIKLGVLGPFITIFAVLGAINAFNMVDGIDGLLGGLSIVTFLSISIVFMIGNELDLAYLCIILVVSLIPYVLLNLGAFGRQRRVFMGDAGSMLIGFTVIWLLLISSQDSKELIVRPVTCLWLIALPLMDMMAIMYRRIKRGRSPFKPDRDHLHHICQRLGYSDSQTLILICSVASIFATIGILGEILEVPEFIMFGGFLICFISYSVALLINWPHRVSK